MTRIIPIPNVQIDGSLISCAGEFIHTNVTVLKDLHIDWGRGNIFQQARPATAEIRLYDPTGDNGTWATKIRTGSALGKEILVWLDDPELGRGWTMYRGNISEMSADHHRIAGDPGRKGWLVSIRATSRETEMGNVFPKKDDIFPPETAINRAIRLRDYQYNRTGIQQIYFQPSDVNKTMWGPDDPAGTSILAHMATFYQSMGTGYSYWPDENVMRYTARYALSGGGGIQFGLLPDDGGPRYVVLRPNSAIYWYPPNPGEGGDIVSYSSFIPGCYCTANGGLHVSRADGVNQTQLDWRDKNDAEPWKDKSTIYPTSLTAFTPARLYKATSWLDTGTDIDATTNYLYQQATQEAKLPPHPDIVWDTKKDGGFYRWKDVRQFLQCGEWAHFSFIAGSRFARWLDQRPVFGRIGGSVHFDGKNWQIGARLQWVRQSPGWNASANVTYTDLQNLGIKWGPPPSNWSPSDRYLHPSITWADLKWVTDKSQIYTY